MRSAALLALLCSGCGRISIDPIADDAHNGQPDAPPTGPGVFAIVAHMYNTCVILDGALSCWGANGSGQLATGDTMDRFAPTPIGTDTDWIAVSPGQDHICGIRAGGTVYCWGGNVDGELGQGDFNPRPTPMRVMLTRPAISIDAYTHTCVVLDNNEMWCWGNNNEGELGQNDPVNSPDIPMPVRVTTATTWTHAAAGQGHTLGNRGDGLYGTGRDVEGELGQGPAGPAQLRVMTLIDTGTWAMIAGGQQSSCGLREDSSIACWGSNTFGPLGTGDTTTRYVPTTIGTGNAWRAIDLDTFHTCALATTNEIYCTGRNTEGQLGNGDQMDRLILTLAVPFNDWLQVAVGRFHTCGMRADHSVWCVGQNTMGQLGVAGTANRPNWQQVL